MAQVVGGPKTWRAEMDDLGYATYYVTWSVQMATNELISNALFAPGLPVAGSYFWATGFSGSDTYVWCRWERKVTIDQERKGDPAEWYLVECVFSNKRAKWRCQDDRVKDALGEPDKTSGSFTKAQKEAKYDLHGTALVSSANEPLTGPALTFDYIRPTVRIEQNVGNLQLGVLTGMVNTVNASPLWGVNARCIKLSNASYERKVQGACGYYYTRTLDFEIDFYNQDHLGNIIGFDQELYDSGRMVLRGDWIRNKTNPGTPPTTNPDFQKWRDDSGLSGGTTTSNVLTQPQSMFVCHKDMGGNLSRVFLDGHGRPANAQFVGGGDPAGPPASAVVKYYRESNFIMLGIPTSF